jgi:putative oxidoreductase
MFSGVLGSRLPRISGDHMQLDANLAALAPRLLSILRIIAALLFLEHGTTKIFGFPQSDLSGTPLFSLFGIAGLFEIVGGMLLLIGLFSRAAAFVLSGEMAFAYFIEHAPMSFFPVNNMGDGPILFCFVFLYISAAGPGPWSLDALRTGERRAEIP